MTTTQDRHIRASTGVAWEAIGSTRGRAVRLRPGADGRFDAELLELNGAESAKPFIDDTSSAAVVYETFCPAVYHVKVPSREPAQVASVVRLQAETVLPVEVERFELCRAVRSGTNGQADVVYAPVQKEILSQLRRSAGLEAGTVVLGAQAIAAAAGLLLTEPVRDGMIMYCDRQGVQMLCLREGELASAMMLDTCIDTVEAAQAQAALLTGDVESILSRMPDADKENAVCVLSKDKHTGDTTARLLGEAGINASAATLSGARVHGMEQLGHESLFDYLPALGAALLAGRKPEEVIFLRKAGAAGDTQEEQQAARVSILRPAAALAAFVVIGLLGLYAMDRASLASIEKRLYGQDGESPITRRLEEHALHEQIARERPDLLGLIEKIHEIMPPGVMLDGFSFEKGQKVGIKGTAGAFEQVYQFQDKLKAAAGVSDVELINPVMDPKKGKLTFAMKFDYRNFTKKR